MAEVTKKKIATIYSLIAGFFLSLFSGHAHAGEMFKTTTAKPIGTTKQAPAVYRTAVTPNTVSAGANFTPAPSSTLNSNTLSAGANFTPAPAALNTNNTEFMNAQAIEDTEAREFILNKAETNGIDATNLPRDFVNTSMIEYLMKEVESLKSQLQTK